MQHARSLIFVETCRIFFNCGMWDLVPRPRVKSTYKCRRHEFNLWVRKKPWRRKWQSTSVFFFFLYHFTILAWRIPQTEELVGLQSVGSQRFRYNLATKQQYVKCPLSLIKCVYLHTDTQLKCSVLKMWLTYSVRTLRGINMELGFISYIFWNQDLKEPNFPVVMYGCESWTVKKAEPWKIDAFELWCWRRLESPLDCKEIHPVYPKGDQSWVFIGRTDAEAETPVLWPLHAKSWLIRKDPDAGRDWRQEEKGTTEDEMVGWHHRLNGHEFE